MANEATLADAAACIAQADSVLLSTHVSPDGDGIGSGLGLAKGLAAMGKEALLGIADPVPSYLSFLPAGDFVRSGPGDGKHWDVLLTLDCGDWERLGDAPGDRSRFGTVINLDHHRSNERYGDMNVVIPEASATGLLAFQLLEEIGAPIGSETALCLYTAIATDTGFFRYSNTDVTTFEAVTELVRAGATPYTVHHALHENNPPSRLRMMGEALRLLEFHGDGRIGIIPLDPGAYQRADAAPEDAEGLVELPRSVAGVEVAVLLRPTLEETAYKASLRSKKQVDVSRVAERFGGGGHARAAGCRLELPLDQARDRLVASIQEELNRAG
ncbi:DHH family phosphoesterase [Thiohalorhabdus sp. Cl-TMA]|uniref:Bifunctional oligoribonuclease/PAP phosphatase NrnA n=1 Tax=Thiohalorhabdus methylotrophus TaxID=3242694 RepID=A0ABV4TU00_9GAMM